MRELIYKIGKKGRKICEIERLNKEEVVANGKKMSTVHDLAEQIGEAYFDDSVYTYVNGGGIVLKYKGIERKIMSEYRISEYDNDSFAN